MIRTFQTVGHGTFVTEQFASRKNVVIDCGSDTSLGLVRELIRTTFDREEQIDGVFLTSLDREHAGGLEFLLQWCSVANVFVPYLHEDERAYTLLRHLCTGGEMDDFLARLIMEPREALAEYQILDPRMFMVKQVAEETPYEKNVFDLIMAMDVMPWRAIEGFWVYVDYNLDWIYVPHVYRQHSGMDQLRAMLEAEGVDSGWMDSVETLRRGWSETPIREALIQSYRRLHRPVSAVSMAVYSGPRITDYRMYEQFTEQGQWSFRSRIYAGGVFTGDLHLGEEAVRAKFLKDFEGHRQLIGTLQLPGHGAESMFHESILPGGKSIVVTTTDTENVLCLPHGKVVREIMDRELPFYVVTEQPGSIARFAVTERLG